MAQARGVPLASEAQYRTWAQPEFLSDNTSNGRPDFTANTPPFDVSPFPEHMHAYAANCKRTLHYQVNGPLLAKRDRLLHDLGVLRAKAVEIGNVRERYLREVENNATESKQQIEAGASIRETRVRRNADEISLQIEEISVFAAEIEESITQEGDDAVSMEFIGRYRSMYDKCDRMAKRSFPNKADADPAEFEKEAKNLTNAVAERDALKNLLAVKDGMIWQLVEEREKLTEEVERLRMGNDDDEKNSSKNSSKNTSKNSSEKTRSASAQDKSSEQPLTERSAVGESPEISGREQEDEEADDEEEGEEDASESEEEGSESQP